MPVKNGGRLSALPALLELAGAGFIIAGLRLVWLPLGLIAAGIVLILSAVALERAGAAEKKRRESDAAAQDQREVASLIGSAPVSRAG